MVDLMLKSNKATVQYIGSLWQSKIHHFDFKRLINMIRKLRNVFAPRQLLMNIPQISTPDVMWVA